jgi:hypothetical protein
MQLQYTGIIGRRRGFWRFVSRTHKEHNSIQDEQLMSRLSSGRDRKFVRSEREEERERGRARERKSEREEGSAL